MTAENDAVQAMADAFLNDPDLHPDVKDNLADVNSPAYLVVPAAPDPESYHALRVILRGILNYFGENGRLVPPKAIVPFNLTAGDISTNFTSGLGNVGSAYENWAICDGSNGTPDLRDKFIRSTDGAAGGTGGSDSSAHTHPIDHNHGSFNSGSESGHTHGFSTGTPSSTIYPSVLSAGVELATGSHTHSGTTGAGSSHNHSVDPPAFSGNSGAASATDNRPAFYQLTYLMRVA